MAGDRTTPAETVTRKPDDDVGKPGPSPAGGGHQTPEQAAITGIDGGGRSDADRERDIRETSGPAGRNPAPFGGSSSGHADQTSAESPDRKAAQGHYKVEKER